MNINQNATEARMTKEQISASLRSSGNATNLVMEQINIPNACRDLTPNDVLMDSRRCIRIVNKDTGATFERNLEPNARWHQAYAHAAQNPRVFIIEMEEEPETVMRVEGDNGLESRPVYSLKELNGLSIVRLKAIGKTYGSKSSSKTAIINDVLNAQTLLIKHAKLENLPE